MFIHIDSVILLLRIHPNNRFRDVLKYLHVTAEKENQRRMEGRIKISHNQKMGEKAGRGGKKILTHF